MPGTYPISATPRTLGPSIDDLSVPLSSVHLGENGDCPMTNQTLRPSDLNALTVFLAAGADPDRLAHWMFRNTDSSATLEDLSNAASRMATETANLIGLQNR